MGRKVGRPLGSGRPLYDRFWDNVEEQGDCLIYTGFIDNGGYGVIFIGTGTDSKSRYKRATHVAWFLYHGTWPEKWMLHTCHNRACVAIDHLYDGDVTDNNRDIHQRTRDAEEAAIEIFKVLQFTLDRLIKPGILDTSAQPMPTGRSER